MGCLDSSLVPRCAGPRTETQQTQIMEIVQITKAAQIVHCTFVLAFHLSSLPTKTSKLERRLPQQSLQQEDNQRLLLVKGSSNPRFVTVTELTDVVEPS